MTVIDLEQFTTARRPPRVVAVIPARGGSQGVPLKNLEPVGGRSLLMRAVAACRQSALIDLVVVSSDHAGILEEARRAGPTMLREDSKTALTPPSNSASRLTESSLVTSPVGSSGRPRP